MDLAQSEAYSQRFGFLAPVVPPRGIEERAAQTPGDTAELQRELDALDLRVARVSVPLPYADELYAFRANVKLVRARLGGGLRS